MSNTRVSKDSSTLRQERYCSSPVYELGLMGNHVAKRACLIDAPEDRALIYFLQQQSHMPGGLKRVAEELLEMFPKRVGTSTQLALNKDPESFYSTDEIREMRREMPDSIQDCFPLKGECDPEEERCYFFCMSSDSEEEQPEPCESFPTQYKVSEVADACRLDAGTLTDHLSAICLNPELDLHKPATVSKRCFGVRSAPRAISAGLWNFPTLIEALHLYRKRKIEAASHSLVTTAVTNQIHEDLEYGLETKSLVIIEGLERMGKSVSAENFCELHSGKAVYIRLESGTDEKTFFRSIARAIGVSSSAQLKTIEMRAKIQDMLQPGHLMLVIDEAHFLWPQSRNSKTAPKRIDWIRSALVDFGVPVALISTPQFDAQCAHYEKEIDWNSRQIRGRVALHTKLDPELSVEDLEAIARHKLPQADEKSIKLLRAAAEIKEDYVAGIERIAKRANYFATKSGKAKAGLNDVKRAFREIVPTKAARKTPDGTTDQSTPAEGLQDRLKPGAKPVKRRNRIQPLVTQ